MSRIPILSTKSEKEVHYDFKEVQFACVEFPGEFGSGMTLAKCDSYMDLDIDVLLAREERILVVLC